MSAFLSFTWVKISFSECLMVDCEAEKEVIGQRSRAGQ